MKLLSSHCLLIILLLAILDLKESKAQSHDKGTFSIQLNYDGGLHSTHNKTIYKGVVIEDKNDAALSRAFILNASYNPIKFLSVGINLGKGAYIENPDSIHNDGNVYNRIGIDVKGYYLNHEKFNMFLGVQTGFSKLVIHRKAVLIGTAYATQKSIYNAPYLGLNTGFNWYFTKYVGVNMQLGYSTHGFKLIKSYINDTQLNLSDYDIGFKSNGAHIEFGVSVKF